jgi:hypothetical protein
MPCAAANNDSDEEYTGRSARRPVRGRGSVARGAAIRGRGAAGRGQAVDPVDNPVPPLDDAPDELDPCSADELADDLLPT